MASILWCSMKVSLICIFGLCSIEWHVNKTHIKWNKLRVDCVQTRCCPLVPRRHWGDFGICQLPSASWLTEFVKLFFHQLCQYSPPTPLWPFFYDCRAVSIPLPPVSLSPSLLNTPAGSFAWCRDEILDPGRILMSGCDGLFFFFVS